VGTISVRNLWGKETWAKKEIKRSTPGGGSSLKKLRVVVDTAFRCLCEFVLVRGLGLLREKMVWKKLKLSEGYAGRIPWEPYGEGEQKVVLLILG